MLYFCDNDTFSRTEMDKIQIDKKMEGHKWEIISAGLAEFVRDGLIQPMGVDTWILSTPMEGVRQEVNISMPTGVMIASTIEAFFRANDMEYELVDPFNIREDHIMTLLHILNDVLDAGPPPK